MKLIDITRRSITLELDPEDAFVLARACELARSEAEKAWDSPLVSGADADAAPPQIYSALATMFNAAAMAGASWSYGAEGKGASFVAMRDHLDPTRYLARKPHQPQA